MWLGHQEESVGHGEHCGWVVQVFFLKDPSGCCAETSLKGSREITGEHVGPSSER